MKKYKAELILEGCSLSEEELYLLQKEIWKEVYEKVSKRMMKGSIQKSCWNKFEEVKE